MYVHRINKNCISDETKMCISAFCMFCHLMKRLSVVASIHQNVVFMNMKGFGTWTELIYYYMLLAGRYYNNVITTAIDKKSSRIKITRKLCLGNTHSHSAIVSKTPISVKTKKHDIIA